MSAELPTGQQAPGAVEPDESRRARGAGAVVLASFVVLVLALLADLVLAVRTPAPAPVAQPGSAAGTWFCPATAGPEDAAVLSVAAVGDTAAQVTVVHYGGEAPVTDPTVGVSPGEEVTLLLPPGQAALPLAVQWEGGPTAATWRIDEPEAAALPCEAHPSATWFLPGFDTTLGTTSLLHLFNPYRVDAVARIVFATPEGRVALVTTDNVVVPAGRAVQLNLADVQPEVPDLGAVVEVLTGRLFTAGELRFAGRGEGPRGRTLVPASPMASLDWAFAYARADERASSWLAVLNPNDREAAVEVRVSDPNPEGAVLVEEISVPAGGVTRIDLAEASAADEFAVSVLSVNDAPVAVTRLTALRTESGRAGVAASRGAADPANQWALVGGGGGERAARVSLYNPGAERVTVTATAVGAPPDWAEISLGPNARVALELTDAGADRPAIPLRVDASGPVVAELRSQSFGGALQLWTLVGIPATTWTGPPTRPALRRDPRLPAPHRTPAA